MVVEKGIYCIEKVIVSVYLFYMCFSGLIEWVGKVLFFWGNLRELVLVLVYLRKDGVVE